MQYKMAEAQVPTTIPTSKGRPSISVELDDIKYLLALGFTKSKIAEVLGISRKLYIIRLQLAQIQMNSVSIQR